MNNHTLTFSSPRFTTYIVPDFLCPTSKHSRQSNGRSNPEVVGSIPTEVKIFFLYLVWFPDSFYYGWRPVGYSWAVLAL